jgi:autotransporter family porin
MFMRTALVLSLSMVGLANAGVLRVDIDANPNGDGSTWSRAFDSLTDALAVAQPGDQIWVAEGKYTPEAPAGRDATFLIPDGVGVFGGFVGNENSLAGRGDPLDPLVFLDGELGATDNSYHVVTFDGAGSNTILDGFSIANGIADGTSTAQKRGAGIYATDSSPILQNLIVENNIANGNGGGVYLTGTTSNFTQIIDCFIRDNTIAGTKSGGGIWTQIDTIISNTEFLRNTAGGGGGLSLSGTETYLIDNCLFRDNTALTSPGGGAAVGLTQNSSTSVFDQCVFRRNTSPQAGGIGYFGTGVHSITTSRFYANTTGTAGASAVRFNVSNPVSRLTIENSLFTGNTAIGGGTVAGDGSGQLFIQGSTFTKNTTTTVNGSGAIMAINGSVTVDNCILWENFTPNFDQKDSIWYNLLVNLVVNRTIIDALGIGPFPPPLGVGNIDADPLFVDADGSDNTPGTPDDNVRLTEGSPAIDRGSDLLVGVNVFTDIYGNSRFLDDTGTPDTGIDDGFPGIVDLGAAEFQGTTPTDCPPDINDDGTLNFFDISAFLTAFNAQDPVADFNGDGTFNFFDISAFLSAFSAGCP